MLANSLTLFMMCRINVGPPVDPSALRAQPPQRPQSTLTLWLWPSIDEGTDKGIVKEVDEGVANTRACRFGIFLACEFVCDLERLLDEEVACDVCCDPAMVSISDWEITRRIFGFNGRGDDRGCDRAGLSA